MRLWGKIVSGGMFVMAAVLVIVAAMMPEERWKFATAAVALTVAAIYGVPVIVRLFMSLSGDEEVLETGIVGSATVASLKETWLRFNDCPVVQFSLSVEAGGAAYPVEVKQAVDPELLEQLSTGSVVAVRVDRENHKKVVIDWQEPIRAAGGAAVEPSSEKKPAEAPRESGRSSKRSLWPFLRWGFLLFGLVFLRLSCEEGYFEKGGVTAQGIVLKKTYTPGTRSVGGSGTGSPSRHTVSYRFTTEKGKTIEGRYDVLPQTYQKLKEGDPVAVEYLPDSPGTNRIPDQRARSGTWRIMALVTLVGSAVLFVIGWRQRRTQTNP
jgi:hypothetical protein